MNTYWSPFLVLLFLNVGLIYSAGQGIRIESAYYGPPNGVGIDVTRRVQRFADYGEPFRVGNDTLRINPSPNHPQILVVIYDVKDHRISDSVREGEVFYFRIDAEVDRSRGDHGSAIQILRALYGARGHYVDVTDMVRQLVRDRRSFPVSNETFRMDPYQGRQKSLKISYLRGNSHCAQRYEEGDRVQLQ
jgi:hypothetical protein